MPRISRITGPLGLEILYEYDAWANLIHVTRGVREEHYEYSVTNVLDRSNLTAYVDPNAKRTEYAYFPEGAIFPGEVGSESGGKYEYVQYVHEGVGTGEAATTEFLYDATDSSSTGTVRTVVTDARNNATEYILNLDGSPVSITEPGGVLTTMVWSTTDIMKLQETDANNRVTLFDYDGNANLTSESRPRDRERRT